MAVHNPALVGWVIAEMGRNFAWRSIELGYIHGVTDLACVTLGMARGKPSRACASMAARSLRYSVVRRLEVLALVMAMALMPCLKIA